MTIQEKRKQIEELVLKIVKTLDNDKMENYNRYEGMFRLMTDKDFAEWAGSMGHELDDTIQLYQLPFEECSLTQIKKAADILNIPLEEYVWFRDKGDEPIRTKTRVPVGYIPCKRMQQMLNKKNHLSLDADTRALKTGQTTGDSKVSSIVDTEAYGLLSVGADRMMEELYGPRADGYDKKTDFYAQISNKGYADLDELETDLTKHTTLNTINTYLIASGLRSDLVNNTLKTEFTIKQDLNRKN